MQGGPRRGRSPITGPALPPPEAAQTTNKKRPPCPQGTQPSSQRTSPALLSLEALQRKFRHPAAQAAQIKESKSSRVRRTQQTPLKGHARFQCPCPKFSPLVTTSLSLTTSRHSKDFPQPMQRPQNAHSTRTRTLALRGAEGDRRAQRGSSRSRSRAARAEWWDMEGP